MIDIKDINYKPSVDEISKYINNSLFSVFYKYLMNEYKAICTVEYSKDVWLQGWNVKFKKSGKSLCVVYPKDKYFTVLVVVGNKEKESVENLLFSFSDECKIFIKMQKKEWDKDGL